MSETTINFFLFAFVYGKTDISCTIQFQFENVKEQLLFCTKGFMVNWLVTKTLNPKTKSKKIFFFMSRFYIDSECQIFNVILTSTIFSHSDLHLLNIPFNRAFVII